MNGKTPGKHFNKIRVVKIDGSKPSLGNYLTRWLLRVIDIWSFGGSVAIFTVLFALAVFLVDKTFQLGLEQYFNLFNK